MFAQSQQLFDMWADLATKMATAGLSAAPDVPPQQAARQVRAAVFEAMSQSADRYMRSPQFLELTRTSLDASLQFREQFNEFLTKLRHEMQGVARQDVQSVLAGVHQMERRVMERLDELDKRLDDLAARLGGPAPGAAASQAARKAPRGEK